MSDAPTRYTSTPPKSTPAARVLAEPAGGPARRGLSRPVAFASIAAVFILFMAASSAPSPLYVIYQQEWSFSATTLTTVFAVYVVGMIAALLVLGALSDHIGRRPVLATAIALEAVAMVLFIGAGDVSGHRTPPVVQGVAPAAAKTPVSNTQLTLPPRF
ncbi:MFS transporter, partial [Streptomyces sp. NPDC059466]|uniref:MFS transporter n=1 Tax=Streptomyces sp. NPDC059466 TaxID=3346843 RepID=UPI003679B59D